MTNKQTIFVAEYIKDFNATQAAIRAGYSEKTAGAIGAENLTKPEIQEAISTAMSERAKRTELTQDYIVSNLMEIVSRTMQATPVIKKGEQLTDENGQGVWEFDAKNALRALELLGKHLGMFSDKIKAEISTQELDVTAQIRRALLQWEAEEEQQRKEQQQSA